MLEHELHAGVGHQLAGLERRRLCPQDREHAGGAGRVRQRDQGGDATGEARHELPDDAGDDAERALRPDEQGGEVKPGVVLGEATRAPHRRSVGQNSFQAADAISSGSVAEGPQPPGVAGHEPTDRRADRDGAI